MSHRLEVRYHPLRFGDGALEVFALRQPASLHFGRQIAGRRRARFADVDRLRMRMKNLEEFRSIVGCHTGPSLRVAVEKVADAAQERTFLPAAAETRGRLGDSTRQPAQRQ